MKFSIKDFFSTCEQIPRKLWIWSHLLKKSLMENVIFVSWIQFSYSGLKNRFTCWYIFYLLQYIRKTKKLFIFLGNCFKDRCIREAILESNSSILSRNGRYKLTLNVNGELDIHCATQKIWSSNTANSNATKLHFQEDANIVLYKKDMSYVWSTGTQWQWFNLDPKPDTLVIEDDGNLVLYSPNNAIAWASRSESVCQNGECIHWK